MNGNDDPPRPPLFRFPLLGRPVDGFLEELLAAPDGRALSVEEAMKVYGNLKVRRAALQSALRDRNSRPKLRGYPPRVFISYRWHDDPWKAWVGRLAEYLRGRGLRVFLDQEHQASVGPHGLGIAQYVSRIADSQVFLAIVTPEYLKGEAREWMLEEGQTARLFSATGLKVVILQAEGNALPDWGNHLVIDMRGNLEDFSLLDASLSYDGVILSESEEYRLVEMLEEVQSFLREIRYEEAMLCLDKHTQFAGTDEYRQALAHTLYGLGFSSQAAELTMRVLGEGRCSHETRLDLCQLLDDLGLKAPALFYLCALPPGSRVYGWCVSYLKGNLLDDLGAHRAALNHLRQAERKHRGTGPAVYYPLGVQIKGQKTVTPPKFIPSYTWVSNKADILNNLGYVHLFSLGEPEEALSYFRRALKENAGHQGAWANLIVCLAALGKQQEARRELRVASERLGPVRKLVEIGYALEKGLLSPSRVSPTAREQETPTHCCNDCGATYCIKTSGAICGRCGCDYELLSGIGSICPCCGNTTVVLAGNYANPDGATKPGCPICWSGRLIAAPG